MKHEIEKSMKALLSTYISFLQEAGATAIKIIPMAAFAFVSVSPTKALEFANTTRHTSQLFPKHTIASPIQPPRLQTFTPGTIIAVSASAYSSTPDQTFGNPFITASGARVRHGTLAANFLPFGTTVKIGDRLYTVEDRMAARYNNTYSVDIWMDSREAARTFGRRIVMMEIISLP